MFKKNRVCYGCKERVVGCHSWCGIYIAECEELTEENRKICEARNLDKMVRDYRIKTARRVQHKKDVDWKG